jgi:hypothetical protein
MVVIAKRWRNIVAEESDKLERGWECNQGIVGTQEGSLNKRNWD